MRVTSAISHEYEVKTVGFFDDRLLGDAVPRF
jgi:hypothetical protein